MSIRKRLLGLMWRPGPRARRRAALSMALLIGTLLMAPDPHDHGDAFSLGGLLRPLLPVSAEHPAPHPDKPGDETSQAETDSTCPIHAWNQLVATGLILAICIAILLISEWRFAPAFPSSRPILLGTVRSRAPPILL